MPMLISTPEGFFRAEKRDFFEFSYCGKPTKKAFKKHLSEFNAWWKATFPQYATTVLGPSEYSGWIIGGPGMVTTPADELVKQGYLDRWSDKSSPWTMVHHRYSDWLELLESCEVIPAPLAESRSVRFWRLQEGPLLISPMQNGRLLSLRDARWWLANFGHRLHESQSNAISGEYKVFTEKEAVSLRYVTIDWENNDELYIARNLESDPEFRAWLCATLSVPQGEKMIVTSDPF